MEPNEEPADADPVLDRLPRHAAGFVPITAYQKLDGGRATLKAEPNGLVQTPTLAPNATYTLIAQVPPGVSALRLEALADDAKRKFLLKKFSLKAAPAQARPEEAQPVALRNPRANHEAPRFGIAGVLTDRGGWTNDKAEASDLTASFDLTQPLAHPQGSILIIELQQGLPLTRLRLAYTTPPSPGELPLPKLSERKPEDAAKQGPTESDKWRRYWMGPADLTDPEGRRWLSAKAFAPGAAGYEGGTLVGQPSLDAKAHPQLAHAVEDIKAFRVPLPDGKYRVRLHYAEPRERDKGARIFSVRIEGRTTEFALDLIEKARKAGVPFESAFETVAQLATYTGRTGETVEVTDGRLDIEFAKPGNVKPPILGAVEIELMALRRR